MGRSFFVLRKFDLGKSPTFHLEREIHGISPHFFPSHGFSGFITWLFRTKITVFGPIWRILNHNGESLKALSINKNFFDFLLKTLAWMKLLATFNSKW